jgi:hypothetical protein
MTPQPHTTAPTGLIQTARQEESKEKIKSKSKSKSKSKNQKPIISNKDRRKTTKIIKC